MTIYSEYQRAMKDLEALVESERQLERYQDYLRHESRITDAQLRAIKKERVALAERLRTMRRNLNLEKINTKRWVTENTGVALNNTLESDTLKSQQIGR